MRETEVLIVGGGPAGSSCAARLREQGVDCLVVDRERFPRSKLCAGWITPEVVSDLKIDIASYPHRFLSFESIRVHAYGLGHRMRCVQHSIRRYEFDAWLLERSGAPVLQHTVREITPDADGYLVDGQIRCRYLVGAGGTRCPVYRSLFRQSLPRARALQAVTLEHELPYDWRDGDCHLWFFQGGLPGYAWYVPKAEGYVNVGIGAMAAQLKARGDDIQGHWQAFARRLDRLGLVDAGRLSPDGYSYWLRAENGPSRVGNAFVVGDAAGLATRDLCEGIGPAVRSGQRAAEAIAGRRDFGLEDVRAHSLGGLPARWLDGRFTRAAA